MKHISCYNATEKTNKRKKIKSTVVRKKQTCTYVYMYICTYVYGAYVVISKD